MAQYVMRRLLLFIPTLILATMMVFALFWKRQAMFKEMADILHQGESHYVPLIWFPLSGALDYRIQNFHVTSFTQNITKLEHIWWDEDAKVPGS